MDSFYVQRVYSIAKFNVWGGTIEVVAVGWVRCGSCGKGVRDMSKAPSLPSHFLVSFFQKLTSPSPWLLTHEHVVRFWQEMWRSGLPVIYSSIYLERGGGVVILGAASGGALCSSTFCCCISEIISFRNLFLVFLLEEISAEKRRSGYEDVIFWWNLMDEEIEAFYGALCAFRMKTGNSGSHFRGWEISRFLKPFKIYLLRFHFFIVWG